MSCGLYPETVWSGFMPDRRIRKQYILGYRTAWKPDPTSQIINIHTNFNANIFYAELFYI